MYRRVIDVIIKLTLKAEWDCDYVVIKTCQFDYDT